jgi:hypothetical protein
MEDEKSGSCIIHEGIGKVIIFFSGNLCGKTTHLEGKYKDSIRAVLEK